MRRVEYIEKTLNNVGGGSYFLTPERFHNMAQDNTMVFSLGPNTYNSDVSGDRRCSGASDSSTVMGTLGQPDGSNTICYYRSCFRHFMMNNGYDTTLPMEKNVIYTIQTGVSPVSSVATTSNGRTLVMTPRQISIADSGYYVCLFTFKNWTSYPDSAPRGFRWHLWSCKSRVSGFKSMNMIPVEYNGVPCFYETISRTVCPEIGGSGNFVCGPYV